ncbi:MAG: hypothetical protein NTY35_16290 [Planctomycetota bacterium]|nr:hypothetical protein [Planctomycetota bacterium]
MFRNLRLIAAGLALLAASASAQVKFNELFVSHIGTDDREFIEVRGTPGTPLTGYMILVVEGDSTSSFGAMDVAIDLSAGVIGANGLYTVGSSTVVPAVNQVVTGTGTPPNANLFENGTDTFYLIETTNVAGVLANLGLDLRIGGMGTVTTLTTDPAITIRDLVGLSDGGASDVIFDSALTFQDGTFLPAGVVRCGDAPFAWNTQLLDFDFIPTVGYIDVSPTTANPNCSLTLGTAYCFGDGSGLACPCANNSTVGNGEGCLNSLGTGGKVTAAGTASISADTAVLTGTGMPNSSALYFQGTNQQGAGLGVVFGDGLRCAGGAVVRLGTKNNVAGTSAYPAVGDPSISVRGLITAPGIRTYQCWYRNAAAFCTASTFNLSNGLEITWGA